MYEQLGYKAFGMPGKLAASCSITMQNIGGEGPLLFILFSQKKNRLYVLCNYNSFSQRVFIPRVETLSLCVGTECREKKTNRKFGGWKVA